MTLADSATLDPRPPALDDVAAHHDALHPPGMYLMRPTLEHLTGSTEEYRVGYDLPVRELGAGAWIEASYSCYRGENGRRHGWPFARTLWFDVRHGLDLDDLGGRLDELARAVGVPGRHSDWRDEHQRADLYAAAVQDVRLHDVLYAAVRHEPERVVAGWVVCAAIEHGDADTDGRWLALESAHVDTRRVHQLLVLRAVRGGAVVTEADVDEWPDWLQRRVTQTVDRLDVLRLLAEHGRSKRVRREAGQRADAWDGPT